MKVTLTGTDDLGQPVSLVAYTDAGGAYTFANPRPSSAAGYKVAQTQPAGLIDGQDTAGTVGGATAGTAGNDVFTGVVLPAGGHGEDYNFGERPATTGLNFSDQAAGVGFWQNKNGQKLINALNGGPGATQLGDWLAATFPNLYGSLAGNTNAQVAAFYKALFALNGKTAPAGSPRADAQVLATALSVYVTNQSLAGDTAAAYGFRVTAYGLGARGVTLGGNGATLGMSGTVSVSVMDLLLAVDARSKNGLMFDANGNGRMDGLESADRTITDLVFGLITDAGGI